MFNLKSLIALCAGLVPDSFKVSSGQQKPPRARRMSYKRMGRYSYRTGEKLIGAARKVPAPYRGEGPRYELRAARRRGAISARQQKKHAKAFRREMKAVCGEAGRAV